MFWVIKNDLGYWIGKIMIIFIIIVIIYMIVLFILHLSEY